MSPLLIMKYLKMSYILSTSLSTLWLVLGPNILVLCFILHVLSKFRGENKIKGVLTILCKVDLVDRKN